MNYTLNKFEKGKDTKAKENTLLSLRRLLPLMSNEKKNLGLAMLAILITSGVSVITPLIIGYTIDNYIETHNNNGIVFPSLALLIIFLIGLASHYSQIIFMGGIGRRTLFNLRNMVFNKLEDLPIAFFNQNKAGDLISRINNDTDQLNQFFSQGLMQFIGSFFVILGTGLFLLFLNFKLGAIALIPAIGVFSISKIISPWVKKRNLRSLQSLGGMSAEIQESLDNFKVIVAFNRLDYFRKKFDVANVNNFKAATAVGVANNVFTPLYGFASNLAQLLTLSFGIYLITTNYLSIGLLISYMLYVNNFYTPLRHLASIWASFQLAMAGFDRISEILALESDMKITSSSKTESPFLLEFKNVSFGYADDNNVLKNINIGFERGKIYALVGPTGGGKTTTASLMARLFDPCEGIIVFDGRDLRSYTPKEISERIGFITQEPFLFSGTVAENIIYGNDKYKNYDNEALLKLLQKENLGKLLSRFEGGLDTKVNTNAVSLSLGQKQLIAFMRAVLRSPELLILDEATANIDTVTEELLEETLNKLPASTTKVIIAHRLNTIDNADEIYFVNSGQLEKAGSMQNAINMLLQGRRSG